MMPLSPAVWQAFRKLVRNGNEPLTGKELRVAPTRNTKDGTWLDALVKQGLLELVARAAPLKPRFPGAKVQPVQFRSTYRLTALGERAAEYGEYEVKGPALPTVDHTGRPILGGS